MEGDAMSTKSVPSTPREPNRYNRGDRVIDRYGEEHEVIRQHGCQVFLSTGGWAHPSNLRRASDAS
jgi:hypothetical protein